MSKTELYLSKIIKYGLYAILLTPLAFWTPALYGFMTPKFILFQVLVEIVFAAWLLMLITASSNTNKENNTNDTNKAELNSRHSYRDSHHLYWRKWLTISLFVFIGVSFLSAIFGVDFSRSFWGIGARMTGLFEELHFFAWFLILITIFSNTNKRVSTNDTNKNISVIRMPFVDWYYYLNFSFAISILVALSAFYQSAGWRLVYGSTFFNNPTFAAPYFLFNFFWGLYQTLSFSNTNTRMHTNDTNKNELNSRHSYNNSHYSYWKNLFFGAGSILILVALFLGEIRGAIIGLTAGLLFLGIGLVLSNILSRRHRIAIAVCCLLLLLGVTAFWQLRDTPFVQSSDLLKKFSEISVATTAQTRILLWQTSLKVFFDRPLLGSGPENFNYLFNAHYDPRFLKYGGISFDETWQDKPHNAFLEVLTEIGLIGAMAYIAIWLAAAFYLFKMFKNNQKFIALILSGAFISYLGAIFFSFDSFGSWFGLYLMLGFLASHNSNTNNTNEHANNTNKVLKDFPFKNIFVIFVLIGIFALEYFNYGIWHANLADADALRIFPRNPAQGISLFKESLSYFSPYKSEYQFDLIASVAGAIEKRMPLPNLEDTINFSLDEADKAIAAHPKDAARYADMAKIYNILGTMGRDPGILAQSETFGKKSLELSPNRQETLFYLARTALLKNDSKSAVELTKQAVNVDPGISLSHWYSGLSYIANNQKSEGISEIKKALGLGYSPQNDTEKNFIRSLGL